MNRYLAQFLVFLFTVTGGGWSLYCVINKDFGKKYTTSVQLKNYLESCPVGVTFILGGFIIWVIWEAFKKREENGTGLTGFQFWTIIMPAYLLGHALWNI